MGYHAKRSPSSAFQWTSCTASIAAQEGLPDNSGEAARLGTCQHQIAAECLEHGRSPQSYLGRKMLFWVHDESDSQGEDWEEAFTDEFGMETSNAEELSFMHEIVVDQDMVDAVSSGTAFVEELVTTSGATLYVEQAVPIGWITGEAKDGSLLEDDPDGDDKEEEATGTSDVIMVHGDSMTTVDFKFGRVKVMAYDVMQPARIDPLTNEMQPEILRMNLQLALYLLGSWKKYGGGRAFGNYTAIIVQPYLKHVSTFSCTHEDLMALADWIRERAESGRRNPQFVPSLENCMFCRAKTTCKARESVVLETALEGFEDIDLAKPRTIVINQLGSLYAKTEMIIDWCKDVQNKVYDELHAGRPVMRNDGLQYKLVKGKAGAREWRDLEEVLRQMKSMRLRDDVIYTRSLISPAMAEKLAKVKKPKKGEVTVPPVIGTTQWNRLQALMHQKEGSPAVALETDPRPAIASALDGFQDVPTADNNCDDLF